MPRNYVLYRPNSRKDRACWLFVSETELDRNMSWLEKGAAVIRTIVFPNTVREAENHAFRNNKSLRSVVLNEGLEELSGFYDSYDNEHDGVFTDSELQRVTLPTTLRVLGASTFYYCKRLRHVTFPKQS